jgi:putative endonuclease
LQGATCRRRAGRSTASSLGAGRPRKQPRGGHERGRLAEDAVAEFLFARGFEILGRNVRIGALELDVVARQGALAVIVEVRTRGAGSYVGAFASIDAKKRAALLRGAERYWRTSLAKVPGVERVRIDVAAVTFDEAGTHVEYVEGAVTA